VTPTVADQQILVGTAATVSAKFVDQNGEWVDAPSTVTVGATNADGSVFLAPGSATTRDGELVTRENVIATALDFLTFTWTAGTVTRTTHVEVVSRFYASAAQIKANDPSIGNRDDKYTPELIFEKRRVVEHEFERITGRAFVPRFARVRVRAGSPLILPHVDIHRDTVQIWSVDSLGALTAVTVPFDLDAEQGVLYGVYGSDLVVSYVHGMLAPPPDLLDVFYMRVRDVMNRPSSGVPARTSTFTSDAGGTYSLLTPGRAGVMTGIGDVDEVLNKYTVDEVIVG